MRWWLRLILTLILAPILWRLATLYLATAQGGAAMDLLRASDAVLLKIYGTFTLPALALLVAILIPTEFILRRLGVTLLIVGLAPLLACLVLLVLTHFIQDRRLDAGAGQLGLAFLYGLVWGLTIRETRADRGQAVTSHPVLESTPR